MFLRKSLWIKIPDLQWQRLDPLDLHLQLPRRHDFELVLVVILIIIQLLHQFSLIDSTINFTRHFGVQYLCILDELLDLVALAAPGPVRTRRRLAHRPAAPAAANLHLRAAKLGVEVLEMEDNFIMPAAAAYANRCD